MTKQELMVNRYVILADYPNSPFKEGDIYTVENNCIENQVKNPEDYPKIFRKLEWYEKRLIEEMPEYLKVITSINHDTNHTGKVIKAIPGGLRIGRTGYHKDVWGKYCSGFDGIILSCFEPATEEEYLKDSK
jgi:hypothetical protein